MEQKIQKFIDILFKRAECNGFKKFTEKDLKFIQSIIKHKTPIGINMYCSEFYNFGQQRFKRFYDMGIFKTRNKIPFDKFQGKDAQCFSYTFCPILLGIGETLGILEKY